MTTSDAFGDSTKEHAPRLPGFFFDLAALALVPLTILAQGHRFGLGYQDLLITFVRHANNPGWLVNDWRLNGAPFHPQLLPIMAWLVRITNEASAFLLLQMVTRFILLTGIWRLVRALLPSGWERVALAAMACVIFEPHFLLGFQYLQAGHWEPGFLGMAFAVWIMMCGIECGEGRRHWTSLALFSGFGMIAHLFICGPVFAVAVAALIARKRPWKEVVWVTLAGLALGSPAWVPAAMEFFFPSAHPLTSREVIQLLQFRHPHHHQPWTWPLDHYVQAVLLLGAGAFAWSRLARGWDRRSTLALPAVLLVYFLVSCAAFAICGRLQIVALLAYLQPFRLLSLLLLLTQIGVLAVLEHLLGSKPCWLYFPVAVLGLLTMALVPLHGAVLIAPLVFWYVPLLRRWEVPSLPSPAFCWVGTIALAGLGYVGVIGMQASPTLQARANRLHHDHWISTIQPLPAARAELTAWVRKNTLPYDMFAIPPAMESFRLWEERPIVVDFRNVPFTNAELWEWAKRVALGANVDPYIPFSSMPTQDANPYIITLLAKTYGARYVVLREKISDPAVVFQNDEYTVLDLAHGSVE